MHNSTEMGISNHLFHNNFVHVIVVSECKRKKLAVGFSGDNTQTRFSLVSIRKCQAFGGDPMKIDEQVG